MGQLAWFASTLLLLLSSQLRTGSYFGVAAPVEDEAVKVAATRKMLQGLDDQISACLKETCTDGLCDTDKCVCHSENPNCIDPSNPTCGKVARIGIGSVDA